MASRYELKSILQEVDALLVRACAQAQLLHHYQVMQRLKDCRGAIETTLLEIEQSE